MSAARSASKHVTVCALDDLEDGAARRFKVDGLALAVVRLGDSVHVIGDRCTHQDISLSEGEVNPDRLELECWKHGSCFSLVTGQPNTLPATRPVPVFDAEVVEGNVVVALP